MGKDSVSVSDDLRDALTDDHLVATLTLDRKATRYASMSSLHCRCFLLALVRQLRGRFHDRCEYWGRIHAHGDGWFHTHAALWCPELHAELAGDPEAAIRLWRDACTSAGFGPASHLEFIRHPQAYAHYLAVTSAGGDRVLPPSGARSVLHSAAFFNPPPPPEDTPAVAPPATPEDTAAVGRAAAPLVDGGGPCCWAVGCSALLLAAALVCFALALRSCAQEESRPGGAGLEAPRAVELPGGSQTRRKFAYVFSVDVLAWDGPCGLEPGWTALRRASGEREGGEMGCTSGVGRAQSRPAMGELSGDVCGGRLMEYSERGICVLCGEHRRGRRALLGHPWPLCRNCWDALLPEIRHFEGQTLLDGREPGPPPTMRRQA